MRPDNPELIRLLSRRYIPVRLTSLKGVDLNTFRFDYDLTLAGIILDGRDSATIARWGARDSQSATERLTLKGLDSLLTRAADVYAARKPGTADRTAPVTLPDRFPLFAKSKRAQEACYHCHYAHDAEIAAQRANGTFRKALLYRFPYPENVGVTLDPDRGNVVRAVATNSPAARTGIRVGDRIERAGETTVYTTADLQWALDPVPDPGTVALRVTTPGKPTRPVPLSLPAGWRQSDISWRPSQGSVPPILGIWEEPLDDAAKQKIGVPADRMALRVSFLFPGAKWAPARGDLRKNDILIAVGGVALPAMTPRQFHTYIRMHFEVGGVIPLTVLRDGQRVEVRLTAADTGIEE